MANSWIEALKIWNQKKGGVWCVPRKGSKAYDDVIAIMRANGKKPVERKLPGRRAEIEFIDSEDERDDRPDDVRKEAERIAEEFVAGLTFEEE